MSFGFTVLLANIPALICAMIAGYLMLKDAGGWGWMIFLAIMMIKNVREFD